MTETILPGVQIEVRPEGLIVPGQITVNNVGMLGTAAKGPVGVPVLLGGYSQAVEVFGAYDRWVEPAGGDGSGTELTLVRALELAYQHGASTVWAMRVASGAAATATAVLASATGDCVRLHATSPGTWANDLRVTVATADANPVVRDEVLAAGNLANFPVVPSAQNLVVVRPGGGGADQLPGIVYDTAPSPSQVGITLATGAVAFGTPPAGTDTVFVTYTVAQAAAVKVTIASEAAAESYNVVSGNDLVQDLIGSDLVTGEALANATEPPSLVSKEDAIPLTGGANGAAGATYGGLTGLDRLLEVDAHIIVGAGQDSSFGDELANHAAIASSDAWGRERIAIVGSGFGDDLTALQSHTLNSDRVVFVAPGINANDNSQSPSTEETLSGAYTAAAVAGKLASQAPHISLTNKVLQVGGLETTFNRAALAQLVQSRILVLEQRQGFRITKGITTSTNTAWHQITTRRTVDFAKLGVRSAALPYIGLLNNERVRAAMRATINGFLATMVDDEMLVSYELDVSATRDEEIRGIARVELVLRPTFSIDFIKVTMFLE